jgi:protein-disulfide isomerase
MKANARTAIRVRSMVMTAAVVTGTAAVAVGPAAAGERHRAGDDSQTILRQLTELRNELKALRDEMGLLRRAVAELPRAAARAAAVPAPLPASVSLGADPPLGDAAAGIGVVAFSDFECPFCRRFHEQTFSKLKETYIAPGKVQYAFRDFPLPMHAQAKAAALAAHCAAGQDAFWPMHDALFTSDKPLGPERFEAVARDLKLDAEAFRACLKEPAAQQEVESDLSYGQGLGVQGTPTFFIGRMKDGQLVSPQRITGAQPFAAFAAAIDALLK